MKLGRRPWFFLAIAGVFVVMLIPTPAEFRWLNIVMAALAAFWAILLGLEAWLADRAANVQDDTATSTDALEGDGP